MSYSILLASTRPESKARPLSVICDWEIGGTNPDGNKLIFFEILDVIDLLEMKSIFQHISTPLLLRLADKMREILTQNPPTEEHQVANREEMKSSRAETPMYSLIMRGASTEEIESTMTEWAKQHSVNAAWSKLPTPPKLELELKLEKIPRGEPVTNGLSDHEFSLVFGKRGHA